MAIYHFTAGVVRRSKGASAVAKSAYNARAALLNEQTGQAHDYTRAEGLLFEGIFAPKDAPEWARDRERLWNEAEKTEKRKDAQLARNIELSLPHELTSEQREQLLKDFVRENFVRQGMVADAVIHAPDREGDERNFHAHILLTMREIGPDGFAKAKARDWNSKEQLQTWRENWERTANRYLERHGHEARIDHRSLAAQGIDREPTEHKGPTASQLEREGKPTERGDINRAIEARNAERQALRANYDILRLAEAYEKARKQNKEQPAAGYDVLREAEADEKNRREINEARAAQYAAAQAQIKGIASGSDSGLAFMMALQAQGFQLATNDRGHFVAVAKNGFQYAIDATEHAALLNDIQAHEKGGLIVPTAGVVRIEAAEEREARRKEYIEKERERAEAAAQWQALAPSVLYDRGGMASQQRDALTHQKDHEKAQKSQEQEKAKAAAQQQREAEALKRKRADELNRQLEEKKRGEAEAAKEKQGEAPRRKDPKETKREERAARTERTEAQQRAEAQNRMREIFEKRFGRGHNTKDREDWERERER